MSANDEIRVAAEDLRPPAEMTVREAALGGPRDDAEFVACVVLAPDERERTDRRLAEFHDTDR